MPHSNNAVGVQIATFGAPGAIFTQNRAQPNLLDIRNGIFLAC